MDNQTSKTQLLTTDLGPALQQIDDMVHDLAGQRLVQNILDRKELEECFKAYGIGHVDSHVLANALVDAGFGKLPFGEDCSAALFKVESIHHIHAEQCLCGFKSHVSRARTKHIMDVTLAALDGAAK